MKLTHWTSTFDYKYGLASHVLSLKSSVKHCEEYGYVVVNPLSQLEFKHYEIGQYIQYK